MKLIRVLAAVLLAVFLLAIAGGVPVLADDGSSIASVKAGIDKALDEKDFVHARDLALQWTHLEPNAPQPYAMLGGIYRVLGQYDLAVNCLEAALTRSSKRDDISLDLIDLGGAHFGKGDFVGAVDDFDRMYYSLRFGAPLQPYAVILGYVASRRGGIPAEVAQEDLKSKTAASGLAELKAWPGPVIRLFLGRKTPEEVLLAAKRGSFQNAQQQVDQECEANFYVAEYLIFKSQESFLSPVSLGGFLPGEAKELLRAAASPKCSQDMIEVGAAKAELSR